MDQKILGPLYFEDVSTQEKTFVLVRIIRGNIGVTFSQEMNGDIEAFFPRSVCEKLVEWLQNALEETEGKNRFIQN